MDLYIRSQDRLILEKYETLQLCQNPDGTWFFNSGLVLGKYKTKQRALEVLDEIQNIIKIKFALQCDKEIAFNGIPEKDINYLLHQCAVFDMPQD